MNDLPNVDKFAPFTKLEVAANPLISDADTDKGECVMPVPDDAPPMPVDHPKLGEPTKRLR